MSLPKFTTTAGPRQSKKATDAIRHFLSESTGKIEIGRTGHKFKTFVFGDTPIPASVEVYNQLHAKYAGQITSQNYREVVADFEAATEKIVLPVVDNRVSPEVEAAEAEARRVLAEAGKRERAERETEIDKQVEELRKLYPNAVSRDGFKTSAAHAAANIKRELVASFPGVKFSVKSSTFSMGDSVDVSWEMGPSQKAVDAILSKYVEGGFDSMQDLYETDLSTYGRAVSIVLGRAKYVSAKNDRWDLKHKLAPFVCAYFNMPFDNGLDSDIYGNDRYGNQSLRRLLSEIVDGYDFPVGITIDDVTGLERVNDQWKIVHPSASETSFLHASQSAPTSSASYDVQKHYHDKRQIDYWLAVPTSRLSTADYESELARCKASGGWYSRKWGKTPGGFAFESEAGANAFAGQPASPSASETSCGPAPTPSPTKTGSAIADKLRTLADGLDETIEAKTAPLSQNWTPKRGREHSSRVFDGEQLRRVQAALNVLADHHEAGTVPPLLRAVTTKKAITELVRTKSNSGTGYYDAIFDSGEPANQSPQAVALRELIASATTAESEAAKAERLKAREIMQAENALRGCDIPGFFPTPAQIVSQMIELACIGDGDNVLEPSAGIGSIALAARDVGAIVSTAEIRSSLCDILKLKGFKPINADFLEMRPDAMFDAVLMNPPFERGQDAKHVQHAWQFLKPGGRLVAVVSEGLFSRSDANATAFREWFETNGGESWRVADGFKGVEAFRQTGVATRVILVTADHSDRRGQGDPADTREPVASEPDCPACGDTGVADSGGVQPWGEPINVPCECLTREPVASESIPYSVQPAERMYNLYWHKDGKPHSVVGRGKWSPMTHAEAITARSKFTNPNDVMLVEVGQEPVIEIRYLAEHEHYTITKGEDVAKLACIDLADYGYMVDESRMNLFLRDMEICGIQLVTHATQSAPTKLDKVDASALAVTHATQSAPTESPFITEYRKISDDNSESIVLIRMGDFYEAFDEHALTLCGVCELTITKRGETPMAGFPYHMLERVIRELINYGYDVAIVTGELGKREVELRRCEDPEQYRIFEGVDHATGSPLFQVNGVTTDYVGEWHTERKDADEELRNLLNPTIASDTGYGATCASESKP